MDAQVTGHTAIIFNDMRLEHNSIEGCLEMSLIRSFIREMPNNENET